MIGWIEGNLHHIAKDFALVVSGGIGYEVFLNSITLEKLKTSVPKRASFYIFTHVREDQLQLFGFETTDEKELFVLLKSVSGIGSKTAQNMLSKLPFAQMVQAIQSKNSALLSSCPGIGKKTAERIVIDLFDKVQTLQFPAAAIHAGIQNDWKSELLSALQNLGYRSDETDQALNLLKPEEVGNFEAALKASLKNLRR